MATIPNSQNYAQINSNVGDKPCEGSRAVKVPVVIDGSDFDDGSGNPIPFSFSVDLSTFSQGIPSPYFSMLQGMIFNSPYGRDKISGSNNISPLLYNFNFNNGLEFDIVSGGLIYMPLPATTPTQVIVTARLPSSIFPDADKEWKSIMYFCNFPVNPGTIGVITIGS